MPGMIWGKVLRSPHPHARIKSIDTSKAEALPGVKAVVTAKDIVDFPIDKSVMLGIQDMRWMCRNVMARDKALFPGHPVAAVAATSEAIAAAGLQADRGRLRGAAVVDRDRRRDQARRADPARVHTSSRASRPTSPASSSTRRATSTQGFKQADVVIERTFTTRPVHQGYIEPHACLVSVAAGRQDHDLELEPGPVHGARHDGAI